MKDGSVIEQVRTIAQKLRQEIEQVTRLKLAVGDERAYESIATALDEARERLEELNLPGEENRLPSSELWKVAGDLLELGWLQNRARTKPRGYAGDFEMLARICDEWRCTHPLGALFDRYFESQAAPQAVRNRTQLMAEIISQSCALADGKLRVISVGSGPAEDVRRAAQLLDEQTRQRLQVTLLDIDPDALEYAGARLASLLPVPNVDLRRENLFRLARNRKLSAELTGASLVYCTGLFDYLDDKDGAALLGAMWGWLAPGGRTLAFNFTLPNPTRTYMEWIGNWYLLYRTREDLTRLAVAAGIPAGAFVVEAEASGVNLYLDARQQR